MLRFISLAIRKIQSRKKEKKLLQIFEEWKQQVNLRLSISSSKKILLIRLDDIGDYILFRNCISAYIYFSQQKNYTITLLGNIAWKDLFEAFDKDKIDNVIWVDKKQYYSNDAYRNNLWSQLNNESFEVVINPSRTRPLLLDDMCAFATGALTKIASCNTFFYKKWNKVSDALYSSLFCLKEQAYIHEFNFNKTFAEWYCGCSVDLNKPQLELNTKHSEDYLIFFIGASAKSKRWTMKRWNDLIELVNKNSGSKIFICGGKEDVQRANEIIDKSKVENLAGKTSLLQMIELINNAKAVVTNDTMAAHIAIAANTPVVILTGGNNYYRFTDYSTLNIKNFMAVVPKIFLKNIKRKSVDIMHYEAVSADIASIKPTEVYEALKKVVS